MPKVHCDVADRIWVAHHREDVAGDWHRGGDRNAQITLMSRGVATHDA